MKKRIILFGLLIFAILDRVFTYLIIKEIGELWNFSQRLPLNNINKGEIWIVSRILMERMGIIEGLVFSFLILVFIVFLYYKFWRVCLIRIVAYMLFVIEGIAVYYNLIGLFYLDIL